MSDAPGHSVVFDLIEESRRFIQNLIDDNERLGRRLADAERVEPRDVGALRERARELEAENEKLANLYVASYRLSGTETVLDTLEVVREVIVNLVGSEDFAVFVRKHDALAYRSLLANGPLAKRDTADLLQDPRVVEALRTGLSQTASGVPKPGVVTAAVPLTAAGQQVGLLVIGNLLAQKAHLAPMDLEIFDLLGQQLAGRLLAGIAQRKVALQVRAFDLSDFEGVALADLPSHRV